MPLPWVSFRGDCTARGGGQDGIAGPSGLHPPSARRRRAPGCPPRGEAQACPGGAGWCRAPPRTAGPAAGTAPTPRHHPGHPMCPPHPKPSTPLALLPSTSMGCQQLGALAPAPKGDVLGEPWGALRPPCTSVAPSDVPRGALTRTSCLEKRWDRSIWRKERSREVSSQGWRHREGLGGNCRELGLGLSPRCHLALQVPHGQGAA